MYNFHKNGPAALGALVLFQLVSQGVVAEYRVVDDNLDDDGSHEPRESAVRTPKMHQVLRRKTRPSE
jgi:hypothetical protein